MSDPLPRLLAWLELPASDDVVARLRRYHDWLVSEAIPGGGLGPEEAPRLWDRHIFDSLLIAAVWDRQASRQVVDVGSGVGLPGIPLAITHPRRRFLLVDRSERRVRLARRAIRVLELTNVDTECSQIAAVDLTDVTLVSRASLPPAEIRELLGRAGRPAEVVIAGSRAGPVTVDGFETVVVESEILASPSWLLRMTPP